MRPGVVARGENRFSFVDDRSPRRDAGAPASPSCAAKGLARAAGEVLAVRAGGARGAHVRSEGSLSVYLGYLSARVPPRRLLASAARKAWRTARLRLGARPLPPTRDELLRGFHVASPTVLAERLASAGRGAIAPDRAAVIATLARAFPAEVERAVVRAERVMAGRLLVFGRELHVARADGGTDWNLRRVLLPPARGRETREDIKLAWAVGRGD